MQAKFIPDQESQGSIGSDELKPIPVMCLKVDKVQESKAYANLLSRGR